MIVNRNVKRIEKDEKEVEATRRMEEGRVGQGEREERNGRILQLLPVIQDGDSCRFIVNLLKSPNDTCLNGTPNLVELQVISSKYIKHYTRTTYSTAHTC